MLVRVSGVFGSVLLVTGNEEFLADRIVRRARRAILDADPEIEIAEAVGSDLAGGVSSLTSPSLFSTHTAFILRDIGDLDDAGQRQIVDFAAAPEPDVAGILVHPGGQKGKGLLAKLRALDTVTERTVQAPKYESDFVRWARDELRGRLDEQAATFLVQAIGHDLRALAGATDQLSAVLADDAPVTLEIVRRYFGGRAEVRGFDIADAAIEGNIPKALEQVRWAGVNQVAAPVIIGSFASGLRSLARLQAAPAGLRDNQLAAQVGAPPFKIKILRRQLAGWDEAGLRTALGAVAEADLAVKGGAADPDYALERMILTIARARRP